MKLTELLIEKIKAIAFLEEISEQEALEKIIADYPQANSNNPKSIPLCDSDIEFIEAIAVLEETSPENILAEAINIYQVINIITKRFLHK